MMSAKLRVNAYLPHAIKPSVFELNNVNLKQTVQVLKKEVNKKINLEQNKYELVYCGCVMEDEATLESCGLKNGVTVQLITKKEETNVSEHTPISDQAIARLASIFRPLSENDSFRIAYQHVSNKEDFNENLIEAIPGLRSDLVSLTIVNDPVLMSHFTDVETIKRAAKSNPTLVEAAQYVAAAIQEEVLKPPASSSNPIAGSSSMSFDGNMGFSGDNDDMDTSQGSEPSTPNSGLRFGTPNTGITIAQLSAALANARSNPPASSSRNIPAPPTPRITSEMFLQAMQQAFESSSNSASTAATPTTPISPATSQPQTQNIQNQLNLMHEMGLLDDTVNIQALHFTNGDVQAAIELVFSGFGDN